MAHYCKKCGRFTSDAYELCVKCEAENKKEDKKNITYYYIEETCIKPQITYKQTTNYFQRKYGKNNMYKCKCGIYVKSRAERTVADFLYENEIPFEYEPESQYWAYNLKWDDLRIKSIHPDFFIRGPINFQGRKLENIYIEYWGLNTPEYIETKEYKLKVYKSHQCTLINLYDEDIYDYENSLTEKLTQFYNGEINY